MNGCALGRRIAVVGPSGSGKTTLAARLAITLDVPHVELDALYWEPDRTPAPADRFRARTEAALAGAGWTVDGNYGTVRDLVWSRAETIVWLDLPLRTVLWRLARRTWRRARRREHRRNGNHQHRTNVLDPGLYKNLFLFAAVKYRRLRRTYPVTFSEYRNLQVVHLRKPTEVEAWLNTLGSARRPDKVESACCSRQ